MTATLRRNLQRVLIAALLCLIFYDVAVDFKIKWGGEDSFYSHGYLIAPIAIFLIYRKRAELAKLSAQPWAAGLGLLIFGCFVRLLGAYSRVNFVSGFSLVIVLVGLVLYLWGRAITWKVLFPLLFLTAMVPAPVMFVNKVSFRMKMLAAQGAVGLLNLLHLGIIRSGSRVDFWREGQVDSLIVGDVCSGLRSLIALLAFGALFAYLAEGALWKKIALFLLAIPTALVANLVRILVVLAAAILWGSPAAVEVNYLKKIGLGGIAGEWGTLHDLTGILIYVVAFVILFGAERMLMRVGSSRRVNSEQTG